MRVKYSNVIMYQGVEFEVEGEYTPKRPAKLTADPYYSTPPEGGNFEELHIKHNGVELYNLLDSSVCNAIEEIARGTILEVTNAGY